jgi:hypothetical protein
MRVGCLLLREAVEGDIDQLLSFRNDPGVNRFMLRTSVDPTTFRQEWQAVPTSDTDFSCVAEMDGRVVAMGFLDVTDDVGQPGMPTRTEALIGYIVEPGSAGKGVARVPWLVRCRSAPTSTSRPTWRISVPHTVTAGPTTGAPKGNTEDNHCRARMALHVSDGTLMSLGCRSDVNRAQRGK